MSWVRALILTKVWGYRMAVYKRDDFTTKDSLAYPWIIDCDEKGCNFVVSAVGELEARMIDVRHAMGQAGPCPRGPVPVRIDPPTAVHHAPLARVIVPVAGPEMSDLELRYLRFVVESGFVDEDRKSVV